MSENKIVLVTRDEVNQLLNKPISDERWEQFTEWIGFDEDLWATIDECIKHAVNSLCEDE